MTLFQKYEVSCSQTKCCLRFYIEKIACKYDKQLTVVAQPSQYKRHQTDSQNKCQKVYFKLLKLI